MNVVLILQFAFNLIFLGLIAGIVAFFVLISRFFEYLKQSHPTIYLDLGEPHLLFNNTPRLNVLILRFIFSADCEEAKDPVLASKTRTLRYLICFFCSLFVLLIGAALYLTTR